MKNRFIFLVFFLVCMILLPKSVMGAVTYQGVLVDNYTDSQGRRVYTRDLNVVFTGSSTINYLEGRLVLNNLELISFDANSNFITDFNYGTLVYKMTSKAYINRDFTFARVVVRQIDPKAECNFGFEPLDTQKVNINEFKIKKEVYKDGKVVSQVKQGEEFQYKITVTSDNNALTTDRATLSDTIPKELEIISAPGATVNGNNVTWDLGVFEKGTSTKTVTVNVRAKEDVKGRVNNVAVLSVGDNTFEDDEPVTITYSDIQIVKKASRSKVTEDMDFYYTIEVRNVGNATSDNVIVEDTLDDNLNFVKASMNYTLTNGKYVFNLGTIAAGAYKTIRIDVKAKAIVNVRVIPNTAIAKEGDKAPVEDDVDVEVVKEEVTPQVSIKKSVSATKVKALEEFNFTITVSNLNDLNLIDLELQDSFDDNLIIVDAQNGNKTNNKVSWLFDLGPNETKDFVVRVKAKSSFVGIIKNVAVVNYEDKDTPSNEVEVEIEKNEEVPKEPVTPNKPNVLPPDEANEIPNPQTGNMVTVFVLLGCSLISLVIMYDVKMKKKLYKI